MKIGFDMFSVLNMEDNHGDNLYQLTNEDRGPSDT